MRSSYRQSQLGTSSELFQPRTGRQEETSQTKCWLKSSVRSTCPSPSRGSPLWLYGAALEESLLSTSQTGGCFWIMFPSSMANSKRKSNGSQVSSTFSSKN